jgi:arylformamidase
MPQLIDLSHRLSPDMPSYPGLPEPEFRVWRSHEESARLGNYASGTTFQFAHYEFGGNTGTYVDAPIHRFPEGGDIAGIPLEKLANLEGLLVDAPSCEIGADAFIGLDVENKAVLARTGWSSRWDTSGYFQSGPYMTAEACTYLVEAGATLVGIDCANIDNMADPARPAHTILLRAGVPIVEHLTNLAAIPAGRGFRFFAVPPAVEGGTSFVVRAFAICD